MRIGFDAKRLFNNFTGLGNYSRFVVSALAEHAPSNEYVLYTPKARTHKEISPITAFENVSVVTPSKLYSLTGTASLWRTWGIARDKTIRSLSVYHGLSQELPVNLPRAIRRVVTVHDLIFYRFPQLYKAIDVSLYKAKVKKACVDADVVVAISEQTADDLRQFLDVPTDKIKVIYQGCHPQFKRAATALEIAGVKKKYGLPEQYMLNVGTVEARKNIVLAVKAMVQVPATARLPLVIVGKETAYKREVVTTAQELGLSSEIIFLHQAQFIDFPALYQGARVFIYPSIFEGFGIPLVEALESGTPAITSTGSCFQEAGGPDSVYVDASRADELAIQLTRVLQDEILREHMIRAGKDFVTRFSSRKIAADLLAVYQAS